MADSVTNYLVETAMAKRRRNDLEADRVDRISNLPRNLIDLILERLPLHDAARTTILSKTWRNVWVMHPQLVFDKKFFFQLVTKKVEQTQLHEVSTIISNILLLHTGPVLKFHLSIPRDLPLPYTDLWIKIISSSGIRTLEILNEPHIAYKMPSYMFSCLELTHLSLSNCILNPPSRFKGFRNLTDVKLFRVVITADMLFGTQLQSLDLAQCTGIEHLGCQFRNNNNLLRLLITDSEEIDWQWFECTKKVLVLTLVSLKESPNYRKKVISLDKLLGNMPDLYAIFIDGFFLKFSEPSPSPLKKLVTMEYLHILFLTCVDIYDLIQIQYVMCLIRSSPKLQRIHILLKWDSTETLAARYGTKPLAARRVERYLELPNFANMTLYQLKTVLIEGIVGLRSELHFIKLLLASSPSLKKIKLRKSPIIKDPKEELKILGELTRFPRASTAAQIIWT
ncbi:F-box domain-containing protein [Heracleum sosnowskyi]|uniref:F-box domain-containing protein n=1 Tax=Heracleum sosnowskyi TaxID=360622 RepID=A0AAD8LZ87_9APIA|nr:F-box domain-containing protein [Heracleum sosnowskyi]